MTRIGAVGLGHMGSALAENIAGCGHDVIAYDVASRPELAGVELAASLEDLAAAADVVVLSLPDGNATQQVLRGILGTPSTSVTHVVDTSTVGVAAAQEAASLAASAGAAYIDAPVSGGVHGARARTLTVMFAAPDEACERVAPVLAALSDRRIRVGDRPGMAQALKLLNNFLSATALAATSEAVSFGRTLGLDLELMLEVLNASSGRSAATQDKFPRHVVPGTYDAGFSNALMAKDLGLYLEATSAHHTPATVGDVTGAVWRAFAEQEPGADFTRIYPFVAGSRD